MTKERKKEKKLKETCGLIVRYSGPNGGVRTRCFLDRGHKGECMGCNY
jgi:hypothetical protein